LQHSLDGAITTLRTPVLLSIRVPHALGAASSTLLHLLYRRIDSGSRASIAPTQVALTQLCDMFEGRVKNLSWQIRALVT
jgi:hypothetical protein